MTRAERRREFRKIKKELFHEKYNKDKYPKLSRQERKSLAEEEALREINNG